MQTGSHLTACVNRLPQLGEAVSLNGVATYEVTIGGVNAHTEVTPTPVFRWRDERASLNGRKCRELTGEEVENLEDPQFAAPPVVCTRQGCKLPEDQKPQ